MTNLKKIIKDFFSEYWKLILILTLCCLVIFSQFLFFGKKFEMINDQMYQYNIFYREWIRVLVDGIKRFKFSTYSWNIFLGDDMFMTKPDMGLVDFLFPFVFVLVAGFKKSIEYSLLVACIVTVIVSGITFKSLLNKLGVKNSYLKDILAIIYALSGVASLYFGNYFFHRFYAVLPLLFLGVEHYLQNNRRWIFSIVVFVLFLQNYYYMYPTSLFLVGYFLASYFSKEKGTLWDALKKALPLIFAYIVGMLLSMFSLLTTLLYITQSTRVGTGAEGLFFQLKVYFAALASQFTPPYNICNDISKFYWDSYDSGHLVWSTFYATSFVVAVLCSIKLIIKDKQVKPFFIVLIVYYMLMMFIPTNSIMHGFSRASFRWQFDLILLELIIVALVADKYSGKAAKFKNYIIYASAVLLFGICLFVKGDYSFESHGMTLEIMILFQLLGLVYIYLLNSEKYKLLTAVICLELIIGNTFICYHNSKGFFYYEDTLNKEYVSYFLSRNEDNYLQRIYIDSHNLMPGGELNQNAALRYGYMSTMCYDTTYQYILYPFMEMSGISERDTDNIIDISNPDLLRLLGVRYIGAYSYDGLPEYREGYEYKFDINAIQMFQMNGFNRIGHTFTKFIKKEDFVKDYHNWNEVLVVDENLYDLVKDCQEAEKKQLRVVEYRSDCFKGEINLDSKAVLFVSLPYSGGWEVTDENNFVLRTYNVDGGFIGVILEEGNHTLSFEYTTPYLKYGIGLSLIGVLLLAAEIYLDKRRVDHV